MAICIHWILNQFIIGFNESIRLQSDSLVVERLIQEPLELIAPADHTLVGQSTVRPANLIGETILLTENGCGYRHLFEQELSRSGVLSQ
jgi:DNA-binding transcriptional LysR family regulator